MSPEKIAQSIRIARPEISKLSEKMYKKYIKQLAECLELKISNFETWEVLAIEEKLSWIAAANEAVAQVAAMNAYQPERLSP